MEAVHRCSRSELQTQFLDALHWAWRSEPDYQFQPEPAIRYTIWFIYCCMIVVFISSHADLFSPNFCDFGLSACFHFEQSSGFRSTGRAPILYVHWITLSYLSIACFQRLSSLQYQVDYQWYWGGSNENWSRRNSHLIMRSTNVQKVQWGRATMPPSKDFRRIFVCSCAS